MGKTPTGVAKMAKKHGKPVIALTGSIQEDATICNENGIDAYFCILNQPTSLEDAMKKDTASKNLSLVAAQAVRLFRLHK